MMQHCIKWDTGVVRLVYIAAGVAALPSRQMGLNTPLISLMEWHKFTGLLQMCTLVDALWKWMIRFFLLMLFDGVIRPDIHLLKCLMIRKSVAHLCCSGWDFTWLELNKDPLYLLSHLYAIGRWELHHLRCGKDVDSLSCADACVLFCVLMWLCFLGVCGTFHFSRCLTSHKLGSKQRLDRTFY